jgi:VIT1/CCC1 family predicted Fe2+/Mn2+ transporter
MFDPVSITVAIATAQQAVNTIKQARALGKDVGQLIGEFSKFFSASTEVYMASNKLRTERATRTDAQIYKMALEIAYAAKAFRDNERELKDILIYSGNGDVYQDMMRQRVELSKERARAQKEQEEYERKRKKEQGEMFIAFLLFLAAMSILIPFGAIIFHQLTK